MPAYVLMEIGVLSTRQSCKRRYVTLIIPLGIMRYTGECLNGSNTWDFFFTERRCTLCSGPYLPGLAELIAGDSSSCVSRNRESSQSSSCFSN